MSNPTGWSAITIKFRGKCIVCNNEIRSGEQALWSKSKKAIKHLDCSLGSSNEVTSSRDNKEESPTHKQEKQFITPKQKRFPQPTLPKKCFIFRKKKIGDDEYDSGGYANYREVESQYLWIMLKERRCISSLSTCFSPKNQ